MFCDGRFSVECLLNAFVINRLLCQCNVFLWFPFLSSSFSHKAASEYTVDVLLCNLFSSYMTSTLSAKFQPAVFTVSLYNDHALLFSSALGFSSSLNFHNKDHLHFILATVYDSINLFPLSLCLLNNSVNTVCVRAIRKDISLH